MRRSDRLRPSPERATWVVAVGIIDFSLEQSIIIPALPVAQAQYRTSPTAVVWIITGFLLALAVVTPVAGRLGDRYGHRLVLLVSLGAFAAGSLMCALADSIGLLIAGRVVQGLGAGVGPLAVAIVRDHLQPARVPRAIGLQIGAGGAGGAIGLLAGGLLTDHVSFRAVFWVLLGAALLLAAAVALWVPESTSRSPARVDWLGALLLGGALAAAMLAASEGNAWGWRSPRILVLFAATLALAAAFVVRELTAREPLIDRRALARRAVWGADLMTFAVGFSLFTAYALVPLIGGYPKSTGYGLGLSTTEIALLLLPAALGALAGGPASARAVTVLGGRAAVALGAAIAGLGYVILLGLDRTMGVIAVGMIPIGFGAGLTLGVLVNVVTLSVAGDETGVNIGLNSVVRAIGTALGVSIAVAILTAGDTLASGFPARSAFTAPLVMSALAAAVVIALVALIPRRADDPVLALAGAGERGSGVGAGGGGG